MALINVQVENGLLQGQPAGNQAISVFKGVPYAAPPVGENRWRQPQPALKWEGVKKAYQFGDICAQIRMAKGSFYQKEFYPIDFPMSEDCLFLNIWTPAQSADEKLPVAFWMHGGGLKQGYSNKLEIDGEAFAKRGIVFVSINYRVGILGFFAHPELTAESKKLYGISTSGNYGILDQIEALKWVRKNIGAFGGDPEKITIFGQSGGGRATMTLSCTPLTKGMFRGAIMQSGGGVGGFMTEGKWDLSDAEALGLGFCREAGIENIAQARKLPIEELIAAYEKIEKARKTMAPCIPNSDGYLLPESYGSILLGGKHHDIKYMIGSNGDDMKMPNMYKGEEGRARFIKEARAYYGKSADEYLKAVCIDEPEKFDELAEGFGPENMFAQALGWAKLQDRLKRTPAYLYCFTMVPPGGDGAGAFHSAEHMYLHQTMLRSWRPYTGRDFDFSNRICGYWTNFIKYGDPNADGLTKWTPYTEADPKYMKLENECYMENIPDSERLRFLNEFALGDRKA